MMQDLFLDYALTALPLAVIAWICVFISRPLFQTRSARIVSQIVAASLLFLSSLSLKGMAESQNDPGDEIFLYLGIYFIVRAIAMYLIASYAKSVGKTPYWSFVGLLNHLIILPVLIFGLWKPEKKAKFTREEMINKLEAMIGDPDTPSDKKDWALKRLKALEKKKS